MLNRNPDSGGLRTYVQGLKDGQSLEDLAAIFLHSDEFRSQPSDASHIRELYSHSLGEKTAENSVDYHGMPGLIATLIEAEEAKMPVPMLQIIAALGPLFADGPGYHWWAIEHERISSSEMLTIETLRQDLDGCPLISLISIVDSSGMNDLREMVKSVRAQLYGKFELFFVVKGGVKRSLVSFLKAQATTDPRLKLVGQFRWLNRAGCFNEALRVVGGNFVGQIDPRDRLAASATLELAHAAQTWPTAQIFFTDEDAVATDGTYHAPSLKTDWDPERMLVHNHLGRSSVFRTELLQRLGGMRTSASGAEEFDLALRAAFAVVPSEIRHIPRVLCHRLAPKHGALMTTLARRSNIAAHFSGRNLDAAARVADTFVRQSGLAIAVRRDPSTRVLRTIHQLPPDPPLVSVIIPTRDRADLLGPCVEGLRKLTDYPKIEIIIVDNGSREAETLTLLRMLASQKNTKIVPFERMFDWSAVNNLGVAASGGEVILLLNNDTEAIHGDWLDEMVVQALRPEVGLVGAKLLYPSDGTVQHAGIVLAANGAGKHVFRHAAGHDPGYLGKLVTVRTVSAVTGACIALRRRVFDQVGGLTEGMLQVSNGDVDLCLRVRQHGYRVVWTPFARLWHKELASRGEDNTPEKAKRAKQEQTYLVDTWGDALLDDPYWNPNLEVTEHGAILAIPSAHSDDWAPRSRSGAVANVVKSPSGVISGSLQ
jgi:GT2 family glycosyltransferase